MIFLIITLAVQAVLAGGAAYISLVLFPKAFPDMPHWVGLAFLLFVLATFLALFGVLLWRRRKMRRDSAQDDKTLGNHNE